MEVFVFVVAALFVGCGIVWLLGYLKRLHQEWLNTLSEVAAEFDLDFEPGSVWRKTSKAQGVVNDRLLTVDTYTVSTGENSQTFTRIRLLTNLPDDLFFEREGLGASFKKMFLGGDHEVGDKVFDERVVVRGDATDLASRLSATNRSTVLENVWDRKITLKESEIKFEEAGIIRDATRLIEIAHAMIAMATGLEEGHEAAPQANEAADSPSKRQAMALVNNMYFDPELDVSLNCAHQLLLDHHEEPEGHAAMAYLLAQADPVQKPGVEVRRHWWRSPELAEHLVSLLREGDDATRLAAIRMLALEGTTQAVVPLLAVAEKWTANKENRAAAREAIAEIQSRVGATEHGALSLVDSAQQGHLSLVASADEGGALSIADPAPNANYLADAVSAPAGLEGELDIDAEYEDA